MNDKNKPVKKCKKCTSSLMIYADKITPDLCSRCIRYMVYGKDSRREDKTPTNKKKREEELRERKLARKKKKDEKNSWQTVKKW